MVFNSSHIVLYFSGGSNKSALVIDHGVRSFIKSMYLNTIPTTSS